MGNDISENVIYLCYYKTKSLQSNHVRVSPTTPYSLWKLPRLFVEPPLSYPELSSRFWLVNAIHNGSFDWSNRTSVQPVLRHVSQDGGVHEIASQKIFRNFELLFCICNSIFTTFSRKCQLNSIFTKFSRKCQLNSIFTMFSRDCQLNSIFTTFSRKCQLSSIFTTFWRIYNISSIRIKSDGWWIHVFHPFEILIWNISHPHTTIFLYDRHPDVCDRLISVQRTFCNTHQRIMNKNCAASKKSHTPEWQS